MVGVLAMNEACNILECHYTGLYREWQALGGTSNIDTIALWKVGEIPSVQLPLSTRARDPFPAFGSDEWYESIKPIKY